MTIAEGFVQLLPLYLKEFPFYTYLVRLW